MTNRQGWRFAGLAFATLLVSYAAAAPGGKSVPTETIIVPQGESGVTPPGEVPPNQGMPEIPGPAPDLAPDVGATAPEEGQTTTKPVGEVVPTVEYDLSKLPTPVRRLREQIIEAASTGDPEKLRPIIAANDEPPVFAFDEIGDPIEFLKSVSGDAEGREILAILIEVLDAGFVHVDVGTPEEVYLWPYFARYPVDKLTGSQIVELFKLIYSDDFDEMKAAGQYFFYRVGISPDGQWKFFVAGD